jgi:hypothetical protein
LSANVALRNSTNTFNGNQYITGGHLFMDNTAEIFAKNASGTYDGFLFPRWSDNATYLNYGTGGFNIRPNSGGSITMFMNNNGNVNIGTTYFIANNGNVGIGTGTPAARLQAQGSGIVNLFAGDLAPFGQAGIETAFNTPQTHIYCAEGPGNNNVFNVGAGGSAYFAGNVGIGTTTPGLNNLQINPLFESANGYGLVVCRTNYGACVQLKSSTGQLGIGLLVDNIANGDANTSMLAIRNNTGGTAQTIMNVLANGNVGIGTATPTKGSLEIDTQNGITPGYNPVGYLNTGGAGGNFSLGPASGSVSIWAQGWVMANTFDAFSDERIKNIKGQSDSAADLKTLLGIKITDFTYKDTIAKGNRPQKKVIAQQVEQVYPQVVSKSTDEVPDIYRKATLKNGWVQLATDLKVGDRVKLIGEKEKGVYPVLEVRDGAFRTDFKPTTEQVFVYGREVKDFRTVDYDAIAMLNVSATQELARKLTSQQEELTGLQASLKQALAEKEALLKRLSALEERDQAREDRLARMESALEKDSAGAKYVSLHR